MNLSISGYNTRVVFPTRVSSQHRLDRGKPRHDRFIPPHPLVETPRPLPSGDRVPVVPRVSVIRLPSSRPEEGREGSPTPLLDITRPPFHTPALVGGTDRTLRGDRVGDGDRGNQGRDRSQWVGENTTFTYAEVGRRDPRSEVG